jgi:metal-responsive CopG/Arc/MetJ family transcriptional regulator
MTLMKRTYALPAETLRQFEEAVAPRQRSSTINTLLRTWLEQRQREQLRQEIIEGCAAMADVYLAIEREYHPLEEEVERAIAA